MSEERQEIQRAKAVERRRPMYYGGAPRPTIGVSGASAFWDLESQAVDGYQEAILQTYGFNIFLGNIKQIIDLACFEHNPIPTKGDGSNQTHLFSSNPWRRSRWFHSVIAWGCWLRTASHNNQGE